MTRTAAVIVAAGAGSRFGGAKQFAPFGGRPLFEWSCEVFQAHPGVDDIVLVLPETRAPILDPGRFSKIVDVVPGGERRQDSVAAGFARLDPERTGFVLVHDGARPLLRPELIDRVLAGAKKTGAAVPVVPPEDTIKEILEGRILRTLDRGRLGRVQTPQGFAYAILRRALARASEDGFTGTDESILVERLGLEVAAVDGDPRNLKVTTPLDLIFAEAVRHENRPGF
jgi:2-C-methyl-D-erythritol 4-phosphate cytidylyltransferase